MSKDNNNAPSFEDLYGGMTAPETLSSEQISRLYNLMEGSAASEGFAQRLNELASRYKTRLARPTPTWSKEQRNQLSSLEKSLRKCQLLCEGMDADLLEALDSTLLLSVFSDLLLTCDLELKTHLPDAQKHSFDVQISSLLQSVRAVQTSKPPLKGRPNTNWALTELILDLGAFFENQTGEAPEKHCHYDGASNSYRGRFLEVLETFLASDGLQKPHSNVALGKAIQRAFAQET